MKQILFLLTILSFSQQTSSAEPPQLVEEGKRLHLSLTGNLPSKTELASTILYLKQGKRKEAAKKIITSDADFLNVTVKSLVTAWTNQSGDYTQPLNDMSALMIGFVRDDMPFNQIFYKDSLYIFKGEFIGASLTPELRNLLSGPRLRFVTTESSSFNPIVQNAHINDYVDTSGDPQVRFNNLRVAFPNSDKIIVTDTSVPDTRFIISRFSLDRNDHYRDADTLGLSLTNSSIMKQVYQSDYLHSDERAVAGILSTREFGRSYLQAGTNRAAVAYTLQHFFCNWVDTLKDSALSDEFVRKDIPRVPGGRESTYKNNCVACHAGLDPLTNAFAYHDYVGNRVLYSFGVVVNKQNSNISNDDTEIGHRVADDKWINFWKHGLNSRLGWGNSSEGYGLASFGQMLGSTRHFGSCMSKRVYEKVCLSNVRSVNREEDKIVDKLSKNFSRSNFNMKKLFADTASSCKE